MNSYLRLDSVELWQVAGWTMVHFLWIGALIGAVAAGCGVVLRRASPNVRYIAAAASLAALPALPLLIAGWLIQDLKTNVRLESSIAAGGTVAEFAPLHIVNSETSERLYNHTAKRSQTGPAAPGSAGGLIKGGDRFAGLNPRRSRGLPSELRTWQFASIANLLESCITYLPWIWFVGTPVTLVLLATGIVGTERLRRAGEPITVGPIAEMSARLRTSLRVGRRVTIAVCERIAAPVLVGILRPMILLPPAALSGWSPDEIEMVLLHELAHVRRWDNLVNLLQRLVESLLFFHPAVWLVSGWMRREREACCDAIVVGHTNRRRAYAELLVSIASQQTDAERFNRRIKKYASGRGRRSPGSMVSAMAAGPLRNRIRYILQLEDDSMRITGKSFGFVLACLLLAATFVGLYLPLIGLAEEVTAEATVDSEGGDENGNKDDADPVTTIELKIDREEPRVELAPSGQPVISADGNRLVIRDEPGKETAESHERRVLGTFQMDPYNPGDLFRAVEEAHADKLYVDIVQNEDKWDLVVVPEPTESNWPALLGQRPRKARVIADKAWARLGLKLVPASSLEHFAYQSHRVGGPIKILGGNVPDGLPLPAFLRRVDDQTFETFDDLHAWLNAQEGKRPIAVKAYAFADGHEYLFDASPTGDAMIQAQGPNRSNQKFPSLEDQKLADLAWRMLQLELEPIGGSNLTAQGPSQNDDLRRVRALGYSGGLLVTGTSQPGGGLKNYFEVQRGDILVGLHVWPTTSLEEVADILTRDDLASLSPLKFYIVRADQSDTDKGHVVTGRITVRTQATQASGGGSRTEAATVEFRGQTSPELTAELRAANIPRDNWPAVANENEIKVLEEHIKTLQSQFERIDALFKAGRRGGNASTRALAAYELAVAKGEQALMQGQHAQAIERFNEAQAQAEDAFKAMSADYEAGNTTYDVVLLTAKNLADIKRKIIQLQQQQTSSNREASLTTLSTRDSDNPFSRAIRSEATPQSNESISVLKKFVEREKEQYERLAELAANNQVSTAEAATQKSNYEISLARLQQAQRALEYHKAMVAMAAAEYETALEASKKAPGAVSESELRKLQLKVQAAEARFKELAE